MPVCVGKLTPEKRKYVEFCLEAHKWTESKLRAGVLASDIAKGFYKFYEDNGFLDGFTYGPCHGTGLIEVEAPWMETSSDYLLSENMTFQVDTFISDRLRHKVGRNSHPQRRLREPVFILGKSTRFRAGGLS